MTIPDEIKLAVTKRFGEIKPWRLVIGNKLTISKCDTWILALRTRIAVFRDQRNGWRKCHTDNYWVYYALELT